MGRHCGRRSRAATRPRSSPGRSMMNSRSSDARTDGDQSSVVPVARRGGHGSAQLQYENRDWCYQKYREDEVPASARAVASKGLRAPGATRPELPLSGRLAIVARQAREDIEHRCHPGHFRTQDALDIVQSFPFVRKQIHVIQVWSVSDCRSAGLRQRGISPACLAWLFSCHGEQTGNGTLTSRPRAPGPLARSSPRLI